MARKCPACGHMNDDSLGFCSKCGEPVDPEVRLAMDLKHATESHHTQKQGTPSRHDDYDYEPVSDDDDDDERRSPLLWILLALVVVVVVVLVVNFAG